MLPFLRSLFAGSGLLGLLLVWLPTEGRAQLLDNERTLGMLPDYVFATGVTKGSTTLRLNSMRAGEQRADNYGSLFGLLPGQVTLSQGLGPKNLKVGGLIGGEIGYGYVSRPAPNGEVKDVTIILSYKYGLVLGAQHPQHPGLSGSLQYYRLYMSNSYGGNEFFQLADQNTWCYGANVNLGPWSLEMASGNKAGGYGYYLLFPKYLLSKGHFINMLGLRYERFSGTHEGGDDYTLGLLRNTEGSGYMLSVQAGYSF